MSWYRERVRSFRGRRERYLSWRARRYSQMLNQYGSRCEWLKDDKFLRDLEGDSVDTEILDEELRSLQEDEPKTCRGKTVKLLGSNPFQIVLCVLVLVDAGVVIAEILLDLDAIRGQYQETDKDLHHAVGFLKYTYADDLQGYNTDDVHKILYILQQKYGSVLENGTAAADITNNNNGKNRTARHLHDLLRATHMLTGGLPAPTSAKMQHSQEDALWVTPPPSSSPGGDTGNGHVAGGLDMQNSVQHEQLGSVRIRHGNKRLRAKGGNGISAGKQNSFARLKRDSDLTSSDGDVQVTSSSGVNDVISTAQPDYNITESEPELPGYIPKKGYTHSEKLLKIAHILHYCSIAILGVFVVQLFLRIYGMGMEFFRRKMELFDGAIILASFALDLVFVNGIGGAQGEEAAALLIVFLLWRILRVINGIMVTAKKRQEFRIKLQKRARRRAEKKIESLEDDKLFKEKEINALRELCAGKGAEEDEIKSCRPRRRSMFQKLDTSAGLSSIASLSLGLSMSMTGGGMPNNVAPRPNSHHGGRRESFQEFMFGMGGMAGLAMPKNRRTSMANQRGDKSPRLRCSSMERVEEESTEDGSKSPKVKAKPVTPTSINALPVSMHPNGTTKPALGKEPNGSAQTGTGSLGDVERRESAASTSSAKQVSFDVERQGLKVTGSVGDNEVKDVANGPVCKALSTSSPSPASPSPSPNSHIDEESQITLVNETETNGRARPVLKKQKSSETTRL